VALESDIPLFVYHYMSQQRVFTANTTQCFIYYHDMFQSYVLAMNKSLRYCIANRVNSRF